MSIPDAFIASITSPEHGAQQELQEDPTLAARRAAEACNYTFLSLAFLPANSTKART